MKENGRAVARKANAWFLDLHGREPADHTEWCAAIEATQAVDHTKAAIFAVIVDKLAKQGDDS